MGSNALVLHPEIKHSRQTSRTPLAQLEEICGLAEAIHLTIKGARVIKINQPRPSHLFGKGQAENLCETIKEQEIDLTIINERLGPVQQRNLEKLWRCKVIDRTALILEIFGERAQTREGKLQVELAALNYQKSRLVRSWTHLERQRGGLGFVGGPGESQIEMDRRLIRERISVIEKQLAQVVKTRQLHRKVRTETPYPLVALVGYTNAGKSTLFNHLTQENVFAKNILFATLDPTIRRLDLPSGMQIMLSDTVGFISNLPTDLIAAFRATLEEVASADLILHVRDASHPDATAQKEDVTEVLNDLLGQEHTIPIIEVYNKADKLDPDAPHLDSDDRTTQKHYISALEGTGITPLLEAIEEQLTHSWQDHHYALPTSNGKAIAWLHAHSHVIGVASNEQQTEIDVSISPANHARFQELFMQQP